jgi:hypothetical protein
MELSRDREGVPAINGLAASVVELGKLAKLLWEGIPQNLTGQHPFVPRTEEREDAVWDCE